MTTIIYMVLFFLFPSEWKLHKSCSFWPQHFNYSILRKCSCYCQCSCAGYVKPVTYIRIVTD